MDAKERDLVRRTVALTNAFPEDASIQQLASDLRSLAKISEYIIDEAARRLTPQRGMLLKRAWCLGAPEVVEGASRARSFRGRSLKVIDTGDVSVRRVERIGELVYEKALRPEPEPLFNSGILIQATLPHRDPGQVLAWTRKNGASTLRVQPLIEERDGIQVACYPYGVIPRLILFWAVTEVQRLEASKRDSRKLYLGQSLAEFMRLIGVDKGGKQYKTLAEQAKRLFGAQITYDRHEWSDSQQGVSQGGTRVSDDAVFWWDPVRPEQSSLFPTYVVLSERFHAYLKGRAYPMDTAIIRALRDSSVALDLYAWLTHRVYAIKDPVLVPWSALAKQLGADYGRGRDFADNARKHIRSICQAWPQLVIEEASSSGKEGSGLLIHPSPPSISPKPTSKQ